MTPGCVAQRLRSARLAYEQDVAAFAAAIGIRLEHVRAIEDGRFSELPAGIYGRSAVKAFAAACGLNGAEMLAEAEPFMVSMDDPIIGLARLKGLRIPQPSAPATEPAVPMLSGEKDAITWRPFAAALIDATIVTAVLVLFVVASATALLQPVAALAHASAAFGVVGMLFAAGYFVCFGGIGGATCGERLMRVPAAPSSARTLTLRAIGARAVQSASEDVRALSGLGARIGRRLALTPHAACEQGAGISAR